MIYRMILPKWAVQSPTWNKHESPPVVEGDLSIEEVLSWNEAYYNAYFLPNYPSQYNKDVTVNGTHVDTFTSVFVDLDMKDYHSSNPDRYHDYETKDAFIARLAEFKVRPSRIVDSGNGIHAYWYINDLTDKDFLRFQRRLARFFKTDPEVSKLYQLMRVPGTINWKNPEEPKLAECLLDEDSEYTAEELSKALPRISDKDEAYCVAHYDKTHGLGTKLEVNDELPSKWFKLAHKGSEPYKLFYEKVKDRSQADYRLGHIMLAAGFSKEEAMSVLMNTSKASERAGVHRYNYADGVVSKVWEHVAEEQAVALADTAPKTGRIRSVAQLLDHTKDDETLKGQRLECEQYFDKTEHGFRRKQVLGLIGGSGIGKTAFGLNIIKGFCMRAPELIHIVVTLEQPELEYIQRWKKMNTETPELTNRLFVLGNYNEDGTYRHLSLPEIEDEVKELERTLGKKTGAVMIDHIGVLKKENRNGENQGLIDICQYMKAFAVNTDTYLIMQSQAPREKASIGDIELDKDAAYGTVFFESFCDFVVTLWQPLKRLYAEIPNLTVTVFKFCKIRHKNVLKDTIKEDVPYPLFLDPETDNMRTLNADEMKSLEFHAKRAITARNRDKKSEPGRIATIDWVSNPKLKPEMKNVRPKQ